MKTGLLVVDMLNDFVDGVLANAAAKEIIEPIALLSEQARQEHDWLVVYANDSHWPQDIELTVFPPHAMTGTHGAAVIADLRPHPSDRLVNKRFYSAFTDTELDHFLRAQQVGRLVLVGQHTDCCVRHTAYDAFHRGYEIVVCPDATTVFEPASEEPVERRQVRALDYLRTYYGVQLTASAALG